MKKGKPNDDVFESDGVHSDEIARTGRGRRFCTAETLNIDKE